MKVEQLASKTLNRQGYSWVVKLDTLAEAAAGYHIDTFRRTPLHGEHEALGATLDKFGGWFRPWNYGDAVEEYWAVREGV